jgi:hypothetical protein
MPRRTGAALSPSVYVRTTAVRRGVLGGDRFWRTIAVMIVAGEVLRRVFGRSPELLSIERLEPGQSVQIRTLPASERRRRR